MRPSMRRCVLRPNSANREKHRDPRHQAMGISGQCDRRQAIAAMPNMLRRMPCGRGNVGRAEEHPANHHAQQRQGDAGARVPAHEAGAIATAPP